jgi:hypothetical protein
MDYLGPVGDAPQLSEERFRTILNQQQQKEFGFYEGVAEELGGRLDLYEVDKERGTEFLESIGKEGEYVESDTFKKVIIIEDIKGQQLPLFDPEGDPLSKKEPWISKVTVLHSKFNTPPGIKQDYVVVSLSSRQQGLDEFEVQFEMKRKGRETVKNWVKRLKELASPKAQEVFGGVFPPPVAGPREED